MLNNFMHDLLIFRSVLFPQRGIKIQNKTSPKHRTQALQLSPAKSPAFELVFLDRKQAVPQVIIADRKSPRADLYITGKRHGINHLVRHMTSHFREGGQLLLRRSGIQKPLQKRIQRFLPALFRSSRGRNRHLFPGSFVTGSIFSKR